MSILSEMLSYPFLVRALVGGMLVSLCASLLGVSLVLKRYSMIGDGLSHVSFGALSIALAIGIIVTSLTTGMTTDVSSYMFGSILAMTKEDMALAVVLSLVVLGLFVICYNQMFAVTFDENFARATGVNVGFYNMVISVLTAVTIVLGMRMMGAMLISSLVIFPCLTSMRVFKSFGGVMISSGLLSLVCFLLGMMASYQFSTPAGASVVVVNLAAFVIFGAWQMLGRRK